MGTVTLVYADETECLRYRNVWVVYHISKPKITFNIFTGPTRKEAPKPRLMTMEEIESDQDSNEDDGDYDNSNGWKEGVLCSDLRNPVM